MSEENVVRVETINDLTLMVPAPGANRSNTEIYTDNGGENGSSGGVVHLKVSDPEIAPELLEQVDLAFERGVAVPSKYDLSTIKAGIRDGIIFIKVKASANRISSVSLDGEE